jgi:arylsulfatase
MRRLLWVLAGLLILAGLYLGLRHGLSGRSDPAEFTPEGPVVDALRGSVRDASIVLLVIDAARADHVGCYGYPRETTPNIDRLAQSSVLFEWHFSQTAETKSSTACLLTSQYADTNLADGPRALIPGTFTMEGGLGRAGFRTLLVSSNLKACPLYGIGDDFQDSIWDRALEGLAEEGERAFHPTVALRAVRQWLADNGDSRFFAYIHFIPPHYPYDQPEAYTELFEGLEPIDFEAGEVAFPERVPRPIPTPPPLPDWINLYDANLRWADWTVGEVEAILGDSGLLDSTLLIVTSDHGEAFGEHGHTWHGRSPHDEACHVPLLIRFPGGKLAGTRIEALTESVDLLPTLFDLVEVEYPAEGIQGRSLLPLIAGDCDSVNDYVFCRAGGSPSKYLVRDKEHALVLASNGEWRVLYDLARDPGQRENVYTKHRAVGEEMADVFRRFAERQRRPPVDFLDPHAVMPPLPDVPEIEMSPEDRARVRRIADLGYL